MESVASNDRRMDLNTARQTLIRAKHTEVKARRMRWRGGEMGGRTEGG